MKNKAFTFEFRILRVTMLAGAIYDFIFGVPILVFPAVLAPIINIEMPKEEIYLRLCGVFLIMVAFFYYLAFRDLERYLGNVAVAIIGRGIGACFFFTFYFFLNYPRTFFLLGLGDLTFAVIHFLFLREEGRNLLIPLLLGRR
jgi:O-antigen/teichoic acid export membrane protein